MKRRWKILGVLVLLLAVLLAVNTITSDNETREAEVTVEGGQILQLSRGAVQVTDSGEPAGGEAGQPVVLLHCYACSLHWFDGIEPLLAERHRVIRIDLLGFGGSEKPEAGYEISNQGAVVAEALNTLDVDGALIAGHSMGGSVATSLAEQASQLVDRLVIIGKAPSDHRDLSLPDRLMHVPVLGEALWRISPDFMVRDKIAEEAFAPGFDLEDGFDDPDQVVTDFEAMTYSSFDAAPAKGNDYIDEAPIDDRLTRASVPALVIFGSEDQIYDADESIEAYSDVPGVRTELLDGLGHSPQVEDPEAVAEELEAFAIDVSMPPARKAKPKRKNKANRNRNRTEPKRDNGDRKRGQRADRRKNNDRRRTKRG